MSSVICTQACPSAGTVILHRGADHTVFCPAGTDGHVRMSACPVFPGIEIIYNDVHTQSYTLPPASTADRTVLDIAGQFGYDNGSKFAKAFRDVIGVRPAAYRAGADGDSCAPESVTPQSC